MRTLRQLTAAVVAAFVVWAGTAGAAHAGFFWFGWTGYDDQLQPGAVIPNDGAPFSERYNFYAGPALYFGGDYNHFAYMDYLDRLDRAQKFGYRIPDPPPFLYQPRCRPCGR